MDSVDLFIGSLLKKTFKRCKRNNVLIANHKGKLNGEGEVAVFSAKRWDCRNRADLIDCATPCHYAQVVGRY